MENEILQIASSFTCIPIARALRPAIINAGIAQDLSFVQYAQMSEYMLAPSADSAQIMGTVVLVRVEDWLRDDLKNASPEAPDSAQKARQKIPPQINEFVSQLSVLARRARPVWVLACPSSGWIASRHKLEAVCRNYTNLLAARVQNVSNVTALTWPASLFSGEIEDHGADRLGQIPFTQEVFDKLASFLGQQLERTGLHRASPPAADSASSPELADYLAGLHVHVRLVPAEPRDRPHVDRILRTAAAFTLTGEKREITEAEVDALIHTCTCMLISVSDRLSDHGPSGVVAFHLGSDALFVNAFSLSCAVLGKQVEFAVLSALAQIASENRAAKLVFEYRPSERNQMMLSFLQSLTDRESDARYILPLEKAEARVQSGAVAAGAWTVDWKGNLSGSRVQY